MNEEFIKLFYEESQEQLDAAEEALVSYEKEQSISFIEEAYRSLHTIKGAANMFGFNAIGDFTHKVEDILDEIKNGSIEDPVAVTNRLINYVDHVKSILSDPSMQQEQTKSNHEMMVDDLHSLILVNQKGETSKVNLEKTNRSTFYLHVQSKVKIEEGSNHPVLDVIGELVEKGKSKVKPHLVDHIYDYWDIYLENDLSVDEIEMEFMFYDSDVEIKAYKLSDSELFGVGEFETAISQIEGLRINEKLVRLNGLIDKLNSKKLAKVASKSTQLKSSSLRVSSQKIEILMNSVSELVTELAHLSLLAKTHSIPELAHLTEKMERHIYNLRDATFDMSLVPVSNIEGRLQRIVRDNSKGLNKEIELVVEGAEIEIDKSFLELLADPFMHILRNAIDHGIETIDERLEADKPAKGVITLKVYRSGTDVVFDFKDDGQGLDKERIFEKAVEKGIINSSAQLVENEIFELIFHPGFSTAHEVTNISGRGVGMDVVRNNIQQLKGSISIASTKAVGTTFSIKVPLTLSILESLLFKVADLSLLIPLNEIKQCHHISVHALEAHSNDVFLIDGQFLPVIDLRQEFEYGKTSAEMVSLLQVGSSGKEVCLMVDEIVGEFQAVIKPIGEHYDSLQYLAGASILGDGSVALLLEPNKVQSLINQPSYA